MTKRFTTIESGIDYGVIDNATNERLFDVDITTKLNELSEENEQLKSFIKKLTSNDGKIWLMNGYVYKTDKILKGDLE